MYTSMQTATGQEISPLGFATATRVTYAALGLPQSAKLSNYRIIWLAWQTEQAAKGKFDLAHDQKETKATLAALHPLAVRAVDYPITATTTWEELANVGHNTWSWECKVPTAQRVNGDALDSYARCPICEPGTA